MNALPSSIETYLEDAGFSQTEVLILKRLLEEDALTLRELAAKTGKSTGVLDQAMKKLVQKDIINKEYINDGYKFSLHSLDAIARWMHQDMKEKRESMARRHQNFESFLATLKKDKHRPDMEYYEGEDGMEKAYRKLLDQSQELLQYVPVTSAIEDDPMRDFKVQYFRERHSKKVFSRVITHNTPLGRRFQSRDPFEYRKTALVEVDRFPFDFEKIIAGDTVACFNLADKRACFIRYKELARMERMFFEQLWSEITTGKAQAAPAAPAAPLNPTEELVKKLDIPLSTKTLSSIREFFISRKSIATFAVLAVLSAAVTFGFYKYTANLHLERVQEQAKSIAATGAIQVKGWNFDGFRKQEDVLKPEYQRLAKLLDEIRSQNEGVTYVYLMRPLQEKGNYEFIADADTVDLSQKDYNKDGVIDSLDVPAFPGQPYNDAKYYRGDELDVPTTYPAVEDAWGSVVTGWAPVKDDTGKTIAIFGVDIFTQRVQDLTLASFRPFLFFLCFFVVFVIIRLAAFNRSLFQELVEAFKLKRFLVSVGICAVLAALVTYGIYAYTAKLNLERVREQVKSIAATGALQFSASDLEQIRTGADIAKSEYPKVIDLLNKIRNQNPSVKYIYLLRPHEDVTNFTFIADADSLDPNIQKDYNGDGVIGGEADQGVPPGKVYDVSDMDALVSRSYDLPTANSKPYTDQWGTFMTGYAPVKDAQNNVAAILGVDIYAKQVHELTVDSVTPFGYFFAFFFLFILIRLVAFNRVFFKKIYLLLNLQRVLVSFLILSIIASLFTYGLYQYHVRILRNEAGSRLMSIAATAAPTFNPEELEFLRRAEDMKSDIYQKNFKKLNEIKKNNLDISYAYILRPTENKMLYEWVVDADSNFDIPSFTDSNMDGISQPDEQNVFPGGIYDVRNMTILLSREALKAPMIEPGFNTDQWGTFISASAPIKRNNVTVAVLGLDMKIDNFYDSLYKKFVFWEWFFGFIGLIVMIIYFYKVSQNRLYLTKTN